MHDEGNPAGELVLSCNGLSKSFGALRAVQDLTFEVRRGDILGIGGPNGAGKTTLFELISGFTRADAGKVVFQGQDITALPPFEVARRGITRLFQSATCFHTMTALENVLVGAAHRGGKVALRWDQKLVDVAREAMDFVGVAHAAATPAGALPVIDRKRLMMAGALAMSPSLILMDEPVGGLTPQETDVMTELVRNVNRRGVTVILIEHVMRFMVGLADRIMILHHGEKLFEGNPAQFTTDSRVREVYLGNAAAKTLQRLAALA